jgi:RHS repeat-associated protein
VALALAPVTAASNLVVPAGAAVVAGAGVAAVAVVAAPAPKAKAASVPVLVLLQNGETTAPETTVLQNAGYQVTQATPATWQGMSASAFQQYAALVIGDPSSGGTCSALTPTTGTTGSDALGTNWQAAVTGNLAVLGTAPAAAGTSDANTLISDATGYAAAGYSSSNSTGTGLYVSLNCEYSAAAAGTAVPLLNGVEGFGAAGGLTVQGGLSCSDAGTVNKWEAAAAGTFGGFASSQLSAGSWPSPACPVEEAFNSWPSVFTPAGYDAGSDAAANFTASDGVKGQPYLLLGAPVSAATQALAPSAGGEVPAGTTAGGAGNPATPGVSQATAGDPVNTENGDFTQSNTDLSIPTFGPALGFTRTYDALVAQQQTQAGTPGPMGYGWTDNFASSLATGRPVPGDIYTLDGLATDNGNGGPAASAPLDSPQGVLWAGGNLFIADAGGNRVQEVAGSTGTQFGIAMTAGDVYTIAGSPTGASGSSGDGGQAGLGLLSSPESLAMDSAGDLFIADTGNNRIQEIPAAAGTQFGQSMTAGDIYTIAGSASGSSGTSGDGGAAGSALLKSPSGVTLSSGGDLFIADTGNNRVQEIAAASGTQFGQSMTAGDMYTVAGSAAGTSGLSGDGGAASSALLKSPGGVALGPGGDLFIADTGNNRVQEVAQAPGTQWGQSMTASDIYTIAGSSAGTSGHTGDGGAAGSALLNGPAAVTLDASGDVYIADTNSNRVQEAAKASGSQFGQSMTAGDIYTIAGSASGSNGFSGDGGTATSALMHRAAGVALDSSGDVLVADQSNNRVRKVTTADVISTFAGSGAQLSNDGNGGPATGAALKTPSATVSDQAGNVYIADTDNNRVQEIAAASHTQFGVAMTAGDVYTIAGSATAARGSSGDGGAATAALLKRPVGVAVDGAGDVFIADTGNNRLQEVAAATGTQFGQSVTAGDIYTIAGSASGSSGSSGDGGAAASALLNAPAGVAADGAGNVYVADAGNNRVQEVAAATGSQFGQSMTAGDIYTIAGSATGTSGSSGDGGAAASALLNAPQGAAADAAGNIYIADTGNNRIQEIAKATGTQFGIAMTAGDIYTIAGSATGASGHSGDGGPAAAGLLDAPQAVTADAAGNLFIADTLNNRIQEIAAANGTQWSAAMTAGDIYTVAGSPADATGDSGDGGPATAALIQNTSGIAVDPAGDLFLTNATNDRLREVAATSAGLLPEYPAGGGVTITQPGGAQVTFYPQTGGQCTAPYKTAGGYCALPQDTNATLTSNSANQTYTYSPAPGSTYTYGWNGALTAETDAAGNTLTITYQTPAPGTDQCPSTATSCNTITSASGRALVTGLNASGLVTSVTDPLGRQWTYGYTGSDLTSATDPLGNKTTYTYGTGATGNPALASDLLTITSPNAQPGGPDAGDSTINTYNPAGQVTTQTDPAGYTTTFDYSGMNPATGNGTVRVNDPDGNTAVYDYTQGALAATSKFTGTTLTSEQDQTPSVTAGGTSGGTLLDTTSTDGNGNTTSNTFDPSGNTTSSTAPDGVGSQTGTTTSQFTALNNASCDGTPLAATPCSSSQTGPTPVAPGGAITPPSSAPPQGVTYTLYDTDGNQLYTTTGVYQPGNSSASYLRTTYQLFKGNSVTLNSTNITCTSTPPSQSLPCATINADGVITQLQYDAQGDLTSSSTPDGNGSELAATTYAHDGDGEQTSTTTPDGNISGANTGNHTTTTAYNADGQQVSVTQAGGSGATVTSRTTSYTYDANGNHATVKDARGYTTTITYNADDEATLATDPDSNAILSCYDGDGNVAQTVPPVGVVANSLTAASCPTAYPSGYGSRLASDATVSTFNALGKQTQQTTPAPAGQSGSETTSYSYDGNGNLIQVTAPPAANGGQNQVTTGTYNAAGELASQTTGYGTSVASTISYCYDPKHDRTAVVYADGNTSAVASCETSSPWVVSSSSYPSQAAYQTTYGYDSAGEVVSTTTPATGAAPNGATTTHTYDPAGNKITSTDPNGVTVTLAYTPLNRTASLSYSGSAAHSVSYTYDANGKKTGMTDASGTSSYVHDPFGELTSVTNGAGQTTGYSYDADGDTTGITYPLPTTATWASSNTVSYGYDNADLLTSATDFNGNKITIGNTRDGLPNTQALGATGDTITTNYDNTDNPSAIALKNSSSTLQSFTYADAPAGDILSETDTPSSSLSPATYTYDAQGRVTSMTPGTGSTNNYGFDASSNQTTLPNGATGTYDHAGELNSSASSGTTTSYTYNADGQRQAASQGSATIASATWNGAGQITAYDNSAADMTAATYDGNGWRVSSTITPSGGSAVTQGYVWNTVPKVPQMIIDSTNAYIYGTGLAPIEQVNVSTGATTYLVTDSLDSVRGTISSTGTLTGTASYDAWGKPAFSGGLTSITPFGYAGGYVDPDRLIYLLNRYYDPDTGQFLSVDPDLTQTLEPYAYAGGNPITNSDPTGDEWRFAGWTIGYTPWFSVPLTKLLANHIGDIIQKLNLNFRIFTFSVDDVLQSLTFALAFYQWYTPGGQATGWIFMFYYYSIYSVFRLKITVGINIGPIGVTFKTFHLQSPEIRTLDCRGFKEFYYGAPINSGGGCTPL